MAKHKKVLQEIPYKDAIPQTPELYFSLKHDGQHPQPDNMSIKAPPPS